MKYPFEGIFYCCTMPAMFHTGILYKWVTQRWWPENECL